MKNTIIVGLLGLMFTIIVTSVGMTWQISNIINGLERNILIGQNALDKRISRIEIKLNIKN